MGARQDDWGRVQDGREDQNGYSLRGFQWESAGALTGVRELSSNRLDGWHLFHGLKYPIRALEDRQIAATCC